nr:hypothetical protein [Bacteroidota bacterium]
LLSYTADGALAQKTVAPVNAAEINYYYHHYLNGNVKLHRALKSSEPGKTNFRLLQKHGNNIDYAITQRGSQLLFSKEYYPNGNLLCETTGPEHQATYRFYHPDGSPDSLTYIVNEQVGSAVYQNKYGTFREFYLSGNPLKEEQYLHGKKDGISLNWHKNGQLASKVAYFEDIQYGPFQSWNADGKIFRIGNIGMGPIVAYDSLGQAVSEQVNFSEFGYRDYLTFSNKYSPTHQPLKTEGQIDNEKREGKVKVFYPDSDKVYYKAHYKNGILDGLFQFYDTLGNKLVECEYQDGWLDGTINAWHPNGFIFQEGNYIKQKKEGLWIEFFPNGEMKNIEIYEHGKLVKKLLQLKHFNPEYLLDYELQKDTLNQQFILKTYSNGKLFGEIVYPFGWENHHRYTYDEYGNLSSTRIYADDASYTKTYYYPGNLKSSEINFDNNLQHGDHITYHKNGEVAISGRYLNGVMHGAWIFIDESGNELETAFYNMGSEIITPPKEGSVGAKCFCNKTFNMAEAKSTLELRQYVKKKKIDKYSSRIKLSKNSYKDLYGRMDDGIWEFSASEDVIINIDGNKGLKLNLSPCRHKYNYTFLELKERFIPFEDWKDFKGPLPSKMKLIGLNLKGVKGAHIINFYVDNFSVEFPTKLLVQTGNPLSVNESGKTAAQAVFPVNHLDGFTYKNHLISENLQGQNISQEHISINRNGKACFSPAELTGTGIILECDDLEIDLHAKSNLLFTNYLSNTSQRIRGKEVSPFKYSKNFMGVWMPEAIVTIPLNEEKSIKAIGEDIVIDGKQISGQFLIKELPEGYTLNLLAKKLKSYGLKIHKGPKDKINDYHIIYFSFKGQ